MPARTRQALQHRRLRRRLVQMHRLRIEFGGEGQHLLARDMARPETAETAGREVFEAERHFRGMAGSWSGSLIVAVLCGNLNPQTLHGGRSILSAAAFGATPCAGRVKRDGSI